MRGKLPVRCAQLVAMCAVSGVLAACHPAEAPSARAPTVSRARPPETLAEVNRTMVVPVAVSDSAVPVDLRFDVPSAPHAGQPFEFRLAVLPQALAHAVTVSLEPSEGLSVQSPEQPIELGKVEAGTVRLAAARLLSTEVGTRVLRVRVTLDLPAGTDSRVFACPVVIVANTAR